MNHDNLKRWPLNPGREEGLPRSKWARRPRKDYLPTPDEMARLDVELARSSRRYLGLRNRLALHLMANSGLRATEMLGALVADWNPKTRELELLGKGTKWRTVRVVPSDADLLNRWLMVKPEGETIVCRQDGGRMSYAALDKIVKRAAARAGIEGPVRCHAFRHMRAVSLAEAGASLSSIQAVLGHSRPTITDAYLRGLNQRAAVGIVDEAVVL